MSQNPVYHKEDMFPTVTEEGHPFTRFSWTPPSCHFKHSDSQELPQSTWPQAACPLRTGWVVTAVGSVATIPMTIPPVSTANPGGILVMKSCAPTCPNSTVSSDGRALSVFCCEGNQCNRSAASGLTSSLGALWASASASLLWALLRAAW